MHELTRRAVEDAARGADLIVLDQHCAYGVVAALREARVPWVHIEHGIEWRLAASVARRAPTPYGVALNGSNAARYWWWERRIVRAATGVVAVSEADAAVFGGWGARRVHVAPNGTRIPDRPAHTPSPRPATRLLFLGSLDYWPNVDACRWLAADLMPAIRREMPAAVLTIVGRNPVAQVRRLHDPAAGVTVAGEVPDVRPWFGSSDVMLVPLRSGHGTKIKMIEAAAHGLPMVATRTADSGLEFGAAGAASVADGRSDFVAKAVELLADAGLRARMSERGRAVARDFDWDVIGERLAGWLAEVASPRVPAAVAPL
jgi:glycosyltransferase involved in cell wall biosynthesis